MLGKVKKQKPKTLSDTSTTTSTPTSTEPELKWFPTLVSSLIVLWEGQPALWQTRHPTYKDRQAKHDALQIIVTYLKQSHPSVQNITPTQVEKKIHALLMQYQHHIRTIKNNTQSGAEASRIQWCYFESLEFLKNRDEPIKSTEIGLPDHDKVIQNQNSTPLINNNEVFGSELEDPNSENVDDPAEPLESDEGMTVINNTDAVPPAHGTQPNSTPATLTIQRNRRPTKSNKRTATIDSTLADVHSIMRDVNERKLTRDECTIFGELVAVKIRKIEDGWKQSLAQKLITEVFHDISIGKYNEPPHRMEELVEQFTEPVNVERITQPADLEQITEPTVEQITKPTVQQITVHVDENGFVLDEQRNVIGQVIDGQIVLDDNIM